MDNRYDEATIGYGVAITTDEERSNLCVLDAFAARQQGTLNESNNLLQYGVLLDSVLEYLVSDWQMLELIVAADTEILNTNCCEDCFFFGVLVIANPSR